MGGEGAGQLLAISFQEMVSLIERDFLCGVESAASYPLHNACEPCAELTEYMQEVLMSWKSKSAKDWRCLMNKRIGISYKCQDRRLVWLDDKLLQVSTTAVLLGGSERHLPILVHAASGCAEEEKALRAGDKT